MDKQLILHGLGVFAEKNNVFFFYNFLKQKNNEFYIAASPDGYEFDLLTDKGTVLKENKRKEAVKKSKYFRISKHGKTYFLTMKLKKGWRYSVHSATSTDLKTWKTFGKIAGLSETGIAVSGYKHRGQYVMYTGEKNIKVAFSKDLKKWTVTKKPVLSKRKGHFDNRSMEIEALIPTKKGLLLLYHVLEPQNGTVGYAVGAALFDKKDPKKLLWRSPEPIWRQNDRWRGEKIYPAGAVLFNKQVLSYWDVGEQGLFVSAYPIFEEKSIPEVKSKRLLLNKYRGNPILKPIAKHFWESQAIFNPAAVYAGGKVHLLYRALGDQFISVLGYASSKDGINIDERLSDPVYVPREPFEIGGCGESPWFSPYMSGGGYGGCEDPRITQIGDRLYMTYVAYDGANPPRVALTSIKTEDFLNKCFFWERPVLISPPGVVDKNACLLPEKIKGKYVVFHRIFPDILIDFLDDLNFDGKTKWLPGRHKIKHRANAWDSRKVGAGPPPLKTKDGWLLIYHSVDDKDDSKYKMGAMLLDLNDPTKVLYRSSRPILEPNESYENNGFKSGVAYPCGAVIVDSQLFVYYGGADTVVCVATADLEEFLEALKSDRELKLSSR